RFLHLLDKPEQIDQAELLIDVYENALARLDNLRQYHERNEGYLAAWLDHDIKTVENRLAWLQSFRDKLDK
ncbi:MAG: hypothetical protein RIB59_03095, partial [Rhodospirillales bacterium]